MTHIHVPQVRFYAANPRSEPFGFLRGALILMNFNFPAILQLNSDQRPVFRIGHPEGALSSRTKSIHRIFIF